MQNTQNVTTFRRSAAATLRQGIRSAETRAPGEPRGLGNRAPTDRRHVQAGGKMSRGAWFGSVVLVLEA